MSVTDGAGSESFAYDLLGRVTQSQKTISGTTYITGYGYNLAGEVTSITYPSGRVVQQTFDAIGRLSGITSSGTTYAGPYSYSPAGQVLGINYANGSVTGTFGYSPERLLPTSLAYAKTGQTLFDVSYSYTQNAGNSGQITQITDNVQPGRSVTYTYDALHRIKTALTTGSVQYPQWGLSWTYDRYGNRTNQTVTAGTAPSNSLTIDANTNRITGTGYTYDANGNMTGEPSTTYKYDAENRLVDYQNGGALYTYDNANLRVKKVSA